MLRLPGPPFLVQMTLPYPPPGGHRVSSVSRKNGKTFFRKKEANGFFETAMHRGLEIASAAPHSRGVKEDRIRPNSAATSSPPHSALATTGSFPLRVIASRDVDAKQPSGYRLSPLVKPARMAIAGEAISRRIFRILGWYPDHLEIMEMASAAPPSRGVKEDRIRPNSAATSSPPTAHSQRRAFFPSASLRAAMEWWARPRNQLLWQGFLLSRRRSHLLTHLPQFGAVSRSPRTHGDCFGGATSMKRESRSNPTQFRSHLQSSTARSQRRSIFMHRDFPGTKTGDASLLETSPALVVLSCWKLPTPVAQKMFLDHVDGPFHAVHLATQVGHQIPHRIDPLVHGP